MSKIVIKLRVSRPFKVRPEKFRDVVVFLFVFVISVWCERKNENKNIFALNFHIYYSYYYLVSKHCTIENEKCAKTFIAKYHNILAFKIKPNFNSHTYIHIYSTYIHCNLNELLPFKMFILCARTLFYNSFCAIKESNVEFWNFLQFDIGWFIGLFVANFLMVIFVALWLTFNCQCSCHNWQRILVLCIISCWLSCLLCFCI